MSTTIILGDDVHELRCTLGEAKRVNAIYGNFVEAFTGIQKFDFATYVRVVAAALDKQPKDIEGAVFATGMDELHKPLTTYLGLLSNGGRPPKPAKEGDAPGEA